MKYGVFWRRALALLLDYVAVLVVSSLAMVMLAPLGLRASNQRVGMLVVTLCCPWLYFAVLESRSAGATLGKRALSLSVRDANGFGLSFGRATERHLGRMLSVFTFGIGFFVALFSKQNRTLHDVLADSVVVSKEPAVLSGGIGDSAEQWLYARKVSRNWWLVVVGWFILGARRYARHDSAFDSEALAIQYFASHIALFCIGVWLIFRGWRGRARLVKVMHADPESVKETP